MERLFVDTSAWMSHVNRADAAHSDVARTLLEFDGRLVTSTNVFDETVTLARARLGHPAAVGIGELLLDPDVVDLIRITAVDDAEAWSLFRSRPDRRYSYTDCTSFALMRKLGIDRALALDDDFRREGFLVLPE